MMNSDDPQLEELARALDASEDYRVLRRLRPEVRFFPYDEVSSRIGVVLDVETTGLDVRDSELIEIGMVKFLFSADDVITSVVDEFAAYNEPVGGIPEQITDLTGISAVDVAGKVLDVSSVQAFLEGVSVIAAHNAFFDRPVVERYVPAFAELPWACTATQIAWRFEGLTGAKLEYLLNSYGLFHDAHRAVDDCHAVLALLTRALPISGELGFRALARKARRTGFRVYATGATFECRAVLKSRGYRWTDGSDGAPRSWWIEVERAQLDAELSFLEQELHLYPEDRVIVRIGPRQRFRIPYG